MIPNAEFLAIPQEEVLHVWHHQKVKDAVEEFVRYSHGEASSQDILANLLLGNYTLWVFNGGVAVTSLWLQWLDVVGLTVHKREAGEILREFEDLAKIKGLRGVRFVSPRKGILRKGERFGYTPRLVEYVKEFEP